MANQENVVLFSISSSKSLQKRDPKAMRTTQVRICSKSGKQKLP
jgi:ribosomal protein L32